MRSALYVRVSTDRQAERYGISSQLYDLRKRNKERHGVPLLDMGNDAFIDDGYSGAELDRPALNRLRQAVKEGLVDVVLVYDPDRLSRKLFHQMILAEEFEKYGVKLEFVTQEVGTSPEDKMFFNVRGLIAEFEREKIRERTMKGSRDKARQGKLVSAGSIPFGFKYNADKATLEEDAEKAKMVRFIFYTFANEDLSLRALATRLNRLQIPTPRGRNKWRSSTLGLILRNETYIGKMYQFRKYHIEPKNRRKPLYKNKKTSTATRPREEWIPVKVPAPITADVFEAVQRKLEKNAALSKRNTKREYLLSGILFCRRCNNRMVGHTMHSIPYYRCSRKGDPDKYLIGRDGKPQPCSNPETRTELLDNEVWDSLCQLIKDPELLTNRLRQHNENHSVSREVLEQELLLCRTRIRAIPKERKRLVEGYRKGFYSDPEMSTEMSAIEKERGELETSIKEIEKQLQRKILTAKQKNNIRKIMEEVNKGLEELDFKGRQRLLRLLVEKIIFDGENLEIQTIIPLGEQLCPVYEGG